MHRKSGFVMKGFFGGEVRKKKRDVKAAETTGELGSQSLAIGPWKYSHKGLLAFGAQVNDVKSRVATATSLQVRRFTIGGLFRVPQCFTTITPL